MEDTKLLQEAQDHYKQWNEENDRRRTRENGWNDIIDAYNNKLPEDWPYLSRVVDPRIRTTLIEKKARLTNAKLRGRLVPREGGDILKARLNNSLLDFQWDSATWGGSMNSKFGEMDIDSRMFGSSFAYVHWKYKEDDGKVVENGNEMRVLDPNNCGLDPNCTNIRDAKWFQMREYVTLEQLEDENDYPGEAAYPGLKELKEKMSEDAQNLRENDYQARILLLKGIEDRLGRDKAFPVIEKVTEFREDKWITFSPKYNVTLRVIKNPYKHRSIPIIQLKYYPLLNDPWGEPEVESVLPIWRAIQATICGFLDTMNIHMRPPLKVVDGMVRMETIQWGPEAVWLVNSLDSVQEYQGTGEPLKYFQATYTSLIAAFNQAMGDLSQGVSSMDPFNKDKTATEVKATTKQQNVRDENNQLYLSECLSDLMRMWTSNNRQFLFANPDMKEYILRIVGSTMFEYFKRSGLDEMHVPEESLMAIKDIIDLKEGEMSPEELDTLVDSAKVPLHPVYENPQEKDPEKIIVKPKMRLSDMGDSAELSLIPEDLDGTYDYIPDVKSMSMSAGEEMLNAQNRALETMINPQITQLLQMEGKRPNVSELLQAIFEGSGLRDSERYFTTIETSPSIPETVQQPGLPNLLTSPAQAGEQMAGSTQVQGPTGAFNGLLPSMGSGTGI